MRIVRIICCTLLVSIIYIYANETVHSNEFDNITLLVNGWYYDTEYEIASEKQCLFVISNHSVKREIIVLPNNAYCLTNAADTNGVVVVNKNVASRIQNDNQNICQIISVPMNEAAIEKRYFSRFNEHILAVYASFEYAYYFTCNYDDNKYLNPDFRTTISLFGGSRGPVMLHEYSTEYNRSIARSVSRDGKLLLWDDELITVIDLNGQIRSFKEDGYFVGPIVWINNNTVLLWENHPNLESEWQSDRQLMQLDIDSGDIIPFVTNNGEHVIISNEYKPAACMDVDSDGDYLATYVLNAWDQLGNDSYSYSYEYVYDILLISLRTGALELIKWGNEPEMSQIHFKGDFMYPCNKKMTPIIQILE